MEVWLLHHYILLIQGRRKEESSSFGHFICIHLILSLASSSVINKSKNIFAKNIFYQPLKSSSQPKWSCVFGLNGFSWKLSFKHFKNSGCDPTFTASFFFSPSLPALPLPPASLIFSSWVASMCLCVSVCGLKMQFLWCRSVQKAPFMW